ncbi:GDSL-type esterase/lipase family protein [Paenibacillus larvae]
MKSTHTIWILAGLTGLIATCLFVAGFGYGVHAIINPPQQTGELSSKPSEPPAKSEVEQKNQIQIVALGDSLTAGTGDSSGEGYVLRLKDKLQNEVNKPVHVLNNLAVPGYVTDQFLQDIDKKSTRDALAAADLIVFTIGGNDLFAGGDGLFTNGAEEFNPKAAEERLEPALAKIKQVFEKIHQANPEATVLYPGLYYPFLDLDSERAGALIIQRWNDRVFQIMNNYDHMHFIPTYDLFEQNLNKYLFTDHFHPNSDGYERIADRMVKAMH